ncbi:MAG: hypothetical protein ABIP37_04500, partial [Methylotenera sp.]
QAEKNNSTGTGTTASPALSLELAPIETKQDKGLDEALNEKIETATVLLSTKEALAENGLSLADEAGLAAATRVANKQAKSKQGLAIATAVEKNASNSAKTASIAKDHVQEATVLQGVISKDVNLNDVNLQNVRLNDVNVKATAQDNSTKNKAAAFDISVSAANQSKRDIEATRATETNQKVAAKAFVANKSVKTPASKSALILLAVAGLLMIWLGLQGFNYLKALLVPEAVIVTPTRPIQSEVIVANPNEGVVPAQSLPADSQDTQVQGAQENKSSVNQSSQAQAMEGAQSTSPLNQNLANSNTNGFMTEGDAPKKVLSKKAKSSTNESLDNESSSKHAPIKLITQAPTTGVDPTLLNAYQAFNRGEDVAAQRLYRQVLQGDIRNVDALLGMAAIAQRQGRDADAAGWYQKVLEIEPRNSIAQSAIISPQGNSDVVGTESRIKSMLALQPDGANLHAALGNLYAEQSQWPLAQEAYFNASRFAPNNADYAFNLAISLDQLGKSNLALKQYQRALELLNKSGASSPDRAQLEARIQALQ